MSYAGNKRNELDVIYEEIKDSLDGVETIVEPFCGTSAFSYYLSLKFPKRFKYVLNDNCANLVAMYRVFKDDELTADMIEKLNAFSVDIDKPKYKKIAKVKELANWFYINKVYQIRAGLYPLEEARIKRDFSDLKQCAIINFLKTEDITITCGDAIPLIEQFRDDKTALVFLDPPYIQTCNDFYSKAGFNIYEYLNKNSINDMGTKMLLVLENQWIINLLFKTAVAYPKTYMGSKKKTTHLIIKNNQFEPAQKSKL